MSIKTMNSTPAADGFTMPAEWAHQQAVWMIWPFRPDNWREAGRFAQATFAKVADAIGQATPVFMGVPAQFMELARGIMPAHVTLVEMASDDCWARDTGPTIVTNAAGECRGVDWGFNAWGGHKGVSTTRGTRMKRSLPGCWNSTAWIVTTRRSFWKGAPSMWMAKAPA